MSIFDRFTTKKEKELKKVDASKESAAVETKETKKAKAEKAPKATKKSKEAAASKVNAIDLTGTLKGPVVTEKAAHASELGQYAFEVNKDATKIAVRIAVEKAYGVHVTGVNIQNVRGKAVRFGRTLGKRSSWKKAIVTLKAGERLDMYEASAK